MKRISRNLVKPALEKSSERITPSLMKVTKGDSNGFDGEALRRIVCLCTGSSKAHTVSSTFTKHSAKVFNKSSRHLFKFINVRTDRPITNRIFKHLV